MQFNITTDYAIRILLYMSVTSRLVTSNELSEELGIPQKYIHKIIKKLKDNHIIKAQRGTTGGYNLIKIPSEITIYEIVSIMEKTIKINRCLEEDHYCSRCATDHCSVHVFFTNIQNEFEQKLRSTTLTSLPHQTNVED